MVGGLDVDAYSSTLDRKMPMSNTGSAVNIYAAGDRIKSSVPTNSTAQYSGTSMASYASGEPFNALSCLKRSSKLGQTQTQSAKPLTKAEPLERASDHASPRAEHRVWVA